MQNEVNTYEQAKLEIPPTLVENDRFRDAMSIVVTGLAFAACVGMGVEKAMQVMPMITAGMLIGSMMLDAKNTVETIETAREATKLGINNSVQEAGLFLPQQPTREDIYRGRGLFIDVTKIILLVGAPILGPIGLVGSLGGISNSVGKTIAALNNKVINRRLERAIELHNINETKS